MAKTVVALYDDFNSANDAVKELVNNGFSRSNISIMANDASGQYSRELNSNVPAAAPASGASEGAGVGAGVGALVGGLGGLLIGLGALTIPGIGPVLAAGPLAAALTGLAGAGVGAVAGGVAGGLIGALVDMGVPEDTAGAYVEGIRRGGNLVTVKTDDQMAAKAVEILNRHQPVDVNDRVAQWRQAGWTGFEHGAPLDTTAPSGVDRAEPRPFEQSPTDIPQGHLHAEDMRTNVETGIGLGTAGVAAEEMRDAGFSRGGSDFSAFDSDFRHHFETTFSDTGYSYDQFVPAYRYGYDLANDGRFQNAPWIQVEPEARRYWDERNPGTWDRFKDAVHHAWEEIKDTAA